MWWWVVKWSRTVTWELIQIVWIVWWNIIVRQVRLVCIQGVLCCNIWLQWHVNGQTIFKDARNCLTTCFINSFTLNQWRQRQHLVHGHAWLLDGIKLVLQLHVVLVNHLVDQLVNRLSSLPVISCWVQVSFQLITDITSLLAIHLRIKQTWVSFLQPVEEVLIINSLQELILGEVRLLANFSRDILNRLTFANRNRVLAVQWVSGPTLTQWLHDCLHIISRAKQVITGLQIWNVVHRQVVHESTFWTQNLRLAQFRCNLWCCGTRLNLHLNILLILTIQCWIICLILLDGVVLVPTNTGTDKQNHNHNQRNPKSFARLFPVDAGQIFHFYRSP